MTYGILSYGAYIPRLRIPRKLIAAANSWFTGSSAAAASGERSLCNWDEDPITMAVAAARDALGAGDDFTPDALRLGSTTFPFLDRLNAGVVAEALNLPEHVSTQDVGGSQRAGTSALIAAIQQGESALVIAAEKRRSRAAGPIELLSGDGAAAIVVGKGQPLARLIGSAIRQADFVDHYRSIESNFDYYWEERWIRDEGYLKLVPPAIQACLDTSSVRAADISAFILPSLQKRVSKAVAQIAGIPDSAVCDSLLDHCGDTGTAHPLLMLVAALETANVGDKILVVGFGQGVDALLFEVTSQNARPPLGVRGHLARRHEEANYGKMLAFDGVVEIEQGMRSEMDKLTPPSALWRNRKMVTGFVGGKCERCGTVQFPASRFCVNPNCNALDTQVSHRFADKAGRIFYYTADLLTYSPSPPACTGLIQFDDGGRLVMDFTDVESGELHVGQKMAMVFRVKDIDAQRGFRRYFWKATPVASMQKGQ